MKLYLKGFMIALMSMLLYSQESIAASYEVQIKQANLGEKTIKTTCTDEKECFLPFIAQSYQSKEIPIIAHLNFVPGNANFKFQSLEGLLYVGKAKASSATNWHKALGKNISLKEKVTLFEPPVSKDTESSILQAPVIKIAHKAIADLEITIEQIQN